MADNQANGNGGQNAASANGSNNGGNFKQNPQRASREGQKGAQAQPNQAKAEGGRNSSRSN